MRRLLALLALLLAAPAWATTTFICAAATGTGDGSTYANCKAAGVNFAGITPSAGDTVRVCGATKIRGAFTITSTNNVTVDLGCTGGTAGTISGADLVTSFTGPDASDEYTSTGTFAVPFVVLLDGVALKEGVKGSLAANEWAFNSANGGTHEILLGTNPDGRTVEVGVRGVGIEFISSTGAAVTGGRLEGIRHTGTATGNAAVNLRASSGTVTGITCYAVRKCVDATATATVTVTGSTVSYAGDGLDANKNTTAPKATFRSNTLSEIGYGGWFTNTATSHGITIDGEAIACTNCTLLIADGNTISHANIGISWRADAASALVFTRNRISDTMSTGISSGCLAGTGVPQYVVASNILTGIGSGNAYPTGTFGITADFRACGNGGRMVVDHNEIWDSSGGLWTDAAALQTGTLTLANNLVVNVNPTGVSGTHYYANWVAMSATNSLTITSDYNNYYQTTGAGFFRWVAGSSARAYSAFSTFQSDSSKEAHATRVDPGKRGGLAPSTTNDFRLAPTSALLRAGLSLGGRQDFLNRLFRTPPSIGAVEQASGDVVSSRTARP